MNYNSDCSCLLFTAISLATTGGAGAQDWPQWRGPDRDGHAAAFEAPDQWPEALSQHWSVEVGDGVATPALVGDRLYVFTLQEDKEFIRCLNVATGETIWSDSYEAQGADGPARSFAGPRSSPAVGEGRVVTLGVRGTVSCLDAATGQVVWRKDDFASWPRFFTSCSPVIADGRCFVQLGAEGESQGAIVAYDLNTGDEAWRWSGDGTAYGSPMLMTLENRTLLVAETARKLVFLDAARGELRWEMPSEVRGRGYNTITPIVHDGTVMLSGAGRGTRAMAVQVRDGEIAGDELWVNEQHSIMFNSPILKGDGVYGLSDANALFCINASTGATAWTTPVTGPEAPEQGEGDRGRRRRGGGGFGSIVDGGEVLMALTPRAELIVFRPDLSAYSEIRRYKVASSETHAYPVLSGRRIVIKDRDSVTLWTVD